MPPVLGAWLMTILGAWVAHRFRADRELPMAVIGSHEFARGLEAELEAVGVQGYRVVGCIDPEQSCSTPNAAGVRCLGSLSLLRGTVLRHGIELLVLGPLDPGEATGVWARGSSGRRRLPPRRLRAGRRRLPRPARVDDRLGTALRGGLRPRAAGHHQRRLVPVLAASPLPGERWPISKRLLDLAWALLAAIVAAPVLLLSAIAIKLRTVARSCTGSAASASAGARSRW